MKKGREKKIVVLRQGDREVGGRSHRTAWGRREKKKKRLLLRDRTASATSGNGRGQRKRVREVEGYTHKE